MGDALPNPRPGMPSSRRVRHLAHRGVLTGQAASWSRRTVTDLDGRQIAGGDFDLRGGYVRENSIRRRRRLLRRCRRRNHLRLFSSSPTLPRYAGAPVLVLVHGGAWTIATSNKQHAADEYHMCDQWLGVRGRSTTEPAGERRSPTTSSMSSGGMALGQGTSTIKVAILVLWRSLVARGGVICRRWRRDPQRAPLSTGVRGRRHVDRRRRPVVRRYHLINRDGTYRANLEEFLAEIISKSPLADDLERWDSDIA